MPRGRILETILSLRFFIFQYGIVYKLHVTGYDTSLVIFTVSPKVTEVQLMMQFTQGVTGIALIAGLILVVTLPRLSIPDLFVCALQLYLLAGPYYLEVYIRISKDMKNAAKDTPSTIREVKAEHIGELVMISGIITRCLDVKPLMQVAVYTCEDCGFEIYQVASGGIDSVGNYIDSDNNVNGVRKYSSVAVQSKLKSELWRYQ